jgi:polar amino acid transport system substrate-binding protein
MFSRLMSRSAAVIACLFLFGSCGSNKPNTGYLIGIDANWYPLDFMGKEKNIYAFSNELLQEIAKKTSMKISTIQMNWDNLFPGLQKEQCDAVLSSLYPYLFNKKKYDFSDLYLNTGPVLVVPYSSKATSLDMLNGKEIAVQADSSDADFLEIHPGIIIRTYDTIPNALNAIVEENLDGALVDVLIAESYCQDIYHGQLKIATPPLNDAGLRLVALHGHDATLIKNFNKGLKELKHSGEYKKLQKKWSLSE